MTVYILDLHPELAVAGVPLHIHRLEIASSTPRLVAYDWTSAVGATKYVHELRSAGVGSYCLYYPTMLTGKTVTVNGLPVNGERIYARLYSSWGTAVAHTDFTYTAQ